MEGETTVKIIRENIDVMRYINFFFASNLGVIEIFCFTITIEMYIIDVVLYDWLFGDDIVVV